MTEIKNIQCNCCGEYIPVESEFCPYCGERVKNGDEAIKRDESLSKSSSVKNFFIALGVLFLIVGVVILLFFIFNKLNPEITLFNSNENYKQPTVIQPKSTLKGIEDAKALIEQDKLDQAAEILQQEIDCNANPSAYYYMGEIYNKRNYTKLAIKTYKQADNAKNKFFEPKKRLAQLYWRMYQIDLATSYAEGANNIKSDDIELLELLFQIYSYNSNIEKLVSTCKQIVKIDSRNYSANYYLANYYYNQNNFRETIPYLENLLKENYNTQFSYTLVLCYAHIEYYTKAIEVLDKIIANDPYETYRATYLKENVKSLREQYRIEHGM